MSEEICVWCKQPVWRGDLAESPTAHDDDYEALRDVLYRALLQASRGKGAERHGQGQPFEDQLMQTICRMLGTEDGLYFQAIKKIQESTRMEEPERKVRELLGAINYIAGAIIYIEGKDKAFNASRGL